MKKKEGFREKFNSAGTKRKYVIIEILAIEWTNLVAVILPFRNISVLVFGAEKNEVRIFDC